MKSLILTTLLFAAFVSQNFGATAVISNQSATNAAVVASAGVLDSVTLYSTNTTPTIVRFYNGAITNITGAYTNQLSYTTNVIQSYVNSLGTTNLMTNSMLWVTNQTVAAATNNTTPFLTLVVPASGTPISYTLPEPFVFTSNLTISNNLTGLSGVVSYRTQ